MFKKVVIGGTFDILHRGHKTLLNVGFQISRSIVIGLTSDEFAARFRVKRVVSYSERERNLREFIDRNYHGEYEIIRIDDFYGISTIDPEIDCIVVSEETLLRAQEINAIRFKKGLPKLTIVVVPIVVAEDGKPISSDRISMGEIDENGRLIGK
ncbi:MAG: phosphopantetheine adenylyltransferase [Candidatus Altiarchaeales archaeon]|nr:MAG: phosphopantetheine adenylyltransferase [Candidatus Altiarchaeales archaeon]RLI93683.1 MAG: phosphopantetheine adenylyltransferase [Candidatus Altiarchaeales archaeon]RLI95074.1 MAG: phosphopantetheine adenylyltransferase [Candidatus Altiarchaeales archaeon]HDO82191.1 phosphopantetheine adenylyltransferase [Candidatus Altiarchaeales archaeon]HEX54840.1 phosphopantetheine adenylyltransferase [Candidatus Altiarchaeales archaeon]